MKFIVLISFLLSAYFPNNLYSKSTIGVYNTSPINLIKKTSKIILRKGSLEGLIKDKTNTNKIISVFHKINKEIEIFRYNEKRGITFRLNNKKPLHVDFSLKDSRWVISKIELGNKILKKSDILKFNRKKGFRLTEESKRFEEFIRRWNKHHDKKETIESISYEVSALSGIRMKSSDNIEYFLDFFLVKSILITHDKITNKKIKTSPYGWQISDATMKQIEVHSQQKDTGGSRVTSIGDISSFVDGDGITSTSPQVMYRKDNRGLTSLNRPSFPVVTSVTCHDNIQEGYIRLAFQMKNNSSSIERFFRGFNTKESEIKLDIDASIMKIHPTNCRHLIINKINNNQGIIINTQGFNKNIYEFNYGYGMVEGRSYMDFVY